MIFAQIQKSTQLVSPQSITHGATATANLDMRGQDYVTLIFDKGANTVATSNAVTVSVLESDNTNATTFATVTANVTHGSSAGVHVYHLDWKARKRYARVSVTPGTAAGDATIYGVVAMLSRQEEGPSTNTDMATSARIA